MPKTRTSPTSPSNEPYLYKMAHMHLNAIIGACNRAKKALTDDKPDQLAIQLEIIRDALSEMPDHL